MKHRILFLIALCCIVEGENGEPERDTPREARGPGQRVPKNGVLRECLKANKQYPGNVHNQLEELHATATCDMFPETCCSEYTEFYMKNEADKFTAFATDGLAARLIKTNNAIESNSLTPTVFSQEFNDLIKKEGTVSYQTFSKAALRYYVDDSCATNALTVELMDTLLPSIKTIADPLKAIYVGLDSIKAALEIATEYKTSDNCRAAIMQNGISTDSLYTNNKCQICKRSSAALRTCKNTCVNTVRGCLNDLTEIASLLEDLANALDVAHYSLIKEIERGGGSLEYIEKEVKSLFDARPSYTEECSTGNPYTFAESGSQAQLARFTGKPLELIICFLLSFDHVCLFSFGNTNCWTADGWTRADTSQLMPFTSFNQSYNPILPKETVLDATVMNGEALLRETLELVNKANTGIDVFFMEGDPEDEETEEEKREEEDPEEGGPEESQGGPGDEGPGDEGPGDEGPEETNSGGDPETTGEDSDRNDAGESETDGDAEEVSNENEAPNNEDDEDVDNSADSKDGEEKEPDAEIEASTDKKSAASQVSICFATLSVASLLW